MVERRKEQTRRSLREKAKVKPTKQPIAQIARFPRPDRSSIFGYLSSCECWYYVICRSAVDLDKLGAMIGLVCDLSYCSCQT